MISGRWYTGPGQAVVPTNFLTVTGTSIGDTVTVEDAGAPDPRADHRRGLRYRTTDGLAMLTDWQTLAAADPGSDPATYDVGLRPGTDPQRVRREPRPLTRVRQFRQPQHQ